MKSKLLFLFLIPTRILFAQTFTEKPGTPFEGVEYGSIAFSDVNGDGYDDVLITGGNFGTPKAKLYLNDGTGIFIEKMDTPFDRVLYSDIAFSDVNSDGYDDVLITGRNSSVNQIAKLYTNDGMGNFTEFTNTPFEGIQLGSIAFSDVNGDEHQDVIITGMKDAQGNELITKLYINDGTGNFTEKTDTPFDAVANSSIAFSDVNSDGHNDVLITGMNSFDAPIAKLYINDGTGNFTEKTDTPFDAVQSGSIAFSDINSDGHDDVLITGLNSSSQETTKLYTNDGTGTFTEMAGPPFIRVWLSSVAFSDVNGDGHNDVLITGMNSSSQSQENTKLYINDGSGSFTERVGTPFHKILAGSIAFSDVNGDGHNDILITGWTSGTIIATLYLNNGVSFTNNFNLEIGLDFSLVPNPATASTLLLHYNSTEKSEVILKIYNANGRLLLQQQTNAVTGPQTFSVDISTLTSGHYFLELDNGTQKGVAQFLIR